MTYAIRRRRLIEVNTDPQRRCYYGCHAKSELQWTAWEQIDSGLTAEKAEDRLKFWRELNDYAVSQRGEVNTRCEFESVPEEQQ